MSKLVTLSGLIVMSFGLAGCDGLSPYAQGPNEVIASGHDTGIDRSGLGMSGHAGIAYDPDGCQGWIMDDGFEGYSGRRYDPVSGLPVCDSKYPPGTVLGNYRAQSPNLRDWVPNR
jgi:hypothetical protein